METNKGDYTNIIQTSHSASLEDLEILNLSKQRIEQLKKINLKAKEELKTESSSILQQKQKNFNLSEEIEDIIHKSTSESHSQYKQAVTQKSNTAFDMQQEIIIYQDSSDYQKSQESQSSNSKSSKQNSIKQSSQFSFNNDKMSPQSESNKSFNDNS